MVATLFIRRILTIFIGCLLFICSGLFCCPAAVADGVQGLGFLDSGDSHSDAVAISADGSVVVGHSDNPGGDFKAFSWTPAGGMTSLSLLSDPTYFWYGAEAVSADGSVVAGGYLNGSGQDRAIVWRNGTPESLAGLGGSDSRASVEAISADGTIIVGQSRDALGHDLATMWSGGSVANLGDLPGGPEYSVANGISADGKVVVGEGRDANGSMAFRWTSTDGMTPLGYVNGNSGASAAIAANADGSVIVGNYEGDRVFRWTQASGKMTDLGLLTGCTQASARAVSADGSVVVGGQSGPSGETAFRWTEATGMQSLNDILTSNGVDMTDWSIFHLSGITPDGETMVGQAKNASGKLEAVIVRAKGVISAEHLNRSLAGMERVGITASSMVKTGDAAMIEAAHNAILSSPSGLSSGDSMTGRNRFWTVGTAASDSSFSGSDFGLEGGVGLTHYFPDGLSVGGGIFSTKRSLDGEYGGKQESRLIAPGVFVGYARSDEGLRLEGGAMVHFLDLDLKRGYQNGAGSAQSQGTTDAQALSLYGRVGWAFPVVDSITIEPFAQYNWQQMHIDGYSESDGPFPAHFSARTEYVNQTRLGTEVRYAYDQNLDFWTWAAWSHRLEDKGPSMSGQLIGLYSFDYSGTKVDQDWGDAGVGYKWRPYGDGFETFSRLSFGIDSEDHAEPDVALTVGLAWDF